MNKHGEDRHFLGSIEVLHSKLVDGCSLYAKAFRNCTVKQKEANDLIVEEL